MAINIYDVAKKAGVSIVTVSRVLNNYPNVRAKNREKVLIAIKELDYNPNAAARTLAKGSTGTIGLILPYMEDSFMRQMVIAIENYLRERGLFLLLSIEEGLVSSSNQSNSIRLFREGRVDGVLIMAPILNQECILELQRKEFPCVILDQSNNGILNVPSIVVDNFEGGYLATQALINSGAKRIGHITGSDYFESSRERFNGYQKALAENGIEFDSNLVISGDFTVLGGYRALKEWAEKEMIPEAIFAADDHLAFGVMNAAAELGINIPSQLKLIGYDNHPFTEQFNPQISSVMQPAAEMGENAVKMLFDFMAGKIQANTQLSLKPKVVLRDSI